MRALRILLVMVVVLGGIFIAVDRAAVYFAESEAEGRVEISGSTVDSTDISIKGFPFLTQVAGSALDEVDIKLTGIETDAGGRRIRISEMNAEFHDVTLADGFSSATAARATGTATVSYEDLTHAADDGVVVQYGDNGKVKVTGAVEILGRTLTRSVTSTVTLVDGHTIRVHADKVPGEGIPGLEGLVRRKTDFEREIGALPNGLKLQRIEPTKTGLEISVTGSDIPLGG
ncbi:LmeA family phospholipid-binding protein [Streptomyces sp. NPDC005134]|uniref:LmeA family phospholipid-binding protein n=1 Tax=Streptomyces sp. NPDC005098 TaxID=3154560 RepID=UPI00339F3EF1